MWPVTEVKKFLMWNRKYHFYLENIINNGSKWLQSEWGRWQCDHWSLYLIIMAHVFVDYSRIHVSSFYVQLYNTRNECKFVCAAVLSQYQSTLIGPDHWSNVDPGVSQLVPDPQHPHHHRVQLSVHPHPSLPQLGQALLGHVSAVSDADLSQVFTILRHSVHPLVTHSPAASEVQHLQPGTTPRHPVQTVVSDAVDVAQPHHAQLGKFGDQVDDHIIIELPAPGQVYLLQIRSRTLQLIILVTVVLFSSNSATVSRLVVSDWLVTQNSDIWLL